MNLTIYALLLFLSDGSSPQISISGLVGDFISPKLDQRIDTHLTEITTSSGTHCDQPRSFFLFADDKLIGELMRTMFADFIINLLVAQIRINAETRVTQAARDRFDVIRLPFRDIQHNGLHRCQP